MKRLLTALLSVFLTAVVASAQYGPGFTPGPYGYGGEPFMGRGGAIFERALDFGLSLLGDMPNSDFNRSFGIQGTGEWRGYINDLFDVGVQLSIAGSRGILTDGELRESHWTLQGGWEGLMDINFFQYYNLTTFAGFGIGRGYGYSNLDGFIRGWLFNPRIGIELFDRFRITGELKIVGGCDYLSYSALGISWSLDPYMLRYRQPRDHRRGRR